MSSPTRFIMVALVGWVGVRAFSLGLFPGGEAWAFDRPAAATDKTGDRASLPPVAVTDFPPLDPVAPPAPYPVASAYGSYAQAYPQPYAMPYPVPVYAAGMSRAPAVVRYAASPAAPRQWGPDEVQGFSSPPPRRAMPTAARRSTSGRSPPSPAGAAAPQLAPGALPPPS